MIQASDRIAIIAGEREITFNEMLQHASNFAQHSPQGIGTKCIIFSDNREGWLFALYGIWAARGIVVPVDASATVSDLAYIMHDCTPEAIWTTRDRETHVRAAIAEAGVEVRILFIEDYEHAAVADLPVADTARRESDTALICYTSGTTGNPKGVMLTFSNILAMASAVSKEVHIFDETTRTIILLPLHHVLPLVGTAFIPMVVGCGVAICPSLSGADIMATLQRGKIGIMVGVPRLWQTLFRGIKAKIDSNVITRALYKMCFRLQNHTLSRLIFSSVHKKMGGNLQYCISGGAALDSDTAYGLKTLGITVLEGYGMTETSPIISFTRPGDIRPGCVGFPMPSVEVKLVDGELCARGRNVMQGYYNRPEETAAVIDAEGFVHTGDLATIDAEGRITITGRRKEIIVLSNGKNVNPVEIEEKIERYEQFVKEAAVTEDNDLLKAIIVPKDEWAKGKTDAEIEAELKSMVLQPYNTTVENYKKVMSLFVLRGELPRTRLEKLQRFKLQEIIASGGASAAASAHAVPDGPTTEEYRIIADYIAAEKHIAVRPTDNMETDLAMDSLDKVSLQGYIEQTFGVKLTADEITGFKDVAALAEKVATAKTHVDIEGIDWQKLLTRPAENLHIPHMATTGIIFTRICKAVYRHMFKTEAYGLENIPTHGPVILAPNHQSFIDAPLVVSHIDTPTLRNTYFYAKRDHVRGPIMRMLAHNHNVVIMDMRTLKDSIRALGQILSDGKNLVIFPEGTRTRTGSVATFKKTFAILAKELNVPIVPVRIEGAFEAWPRTKRLPRRHKVTVTYLPPVTPREDEGYEALAERVRASIIK